MRTKSKKIEECQAFFEIEVPKETIDKTFDEVYEEITKVANISGFRIGKAPRDLVKKHYAGSAREEVLKRLIPAAYKMVLNENKIRPIGFPEITEVSFEEARPLSFKVRVEAYPEFNLKNYRGIKAEKKRVLLKEEDVAKTLENLRELAAKYSVVEGRSVQLGDYVVADLECVVDGKSLHKKRENMWLFVDRESATPGLSEGMVGMGKGSEKEIEVKLPEKYPDGKVAGRPAIYRVKVKEIKTRVLPKLDDDFAKDMGKGSLEALKKEISEELLTKMRHDSDVDVENQILKTLIDENVFKVPRSTLKRQLEYMVDNAKERLVQRGLKKSDLDKKDDEFKEKFKEDALRQVRLFFILDEIARRENIDIDGVDIEHAYKAAAAETGRSEEEIRKYYEKENMAADLEEKLRERKVIDFLVKEANIIEVDK